MSRIGIISAILENPTESQEAFNKIIAENKSLVKGRMGLPFDEHDIAVISITIIGSMDEINSLTGKLGRLKNVTVKTALSQKEV